MADILERFREASDAIQEGWEGERGVLSFSEYLEEFATAPKAHLRDASRTYPFSY